MTEPMPQPRLRTLLGTVDAAPDADYRHLSAEIEEESRDEFSRRLSRLLDACERLDVQCIHLATAVISGAYGRPTRVAQLVLRMHRATLAQFEGGSTDFVADQAIVDRIIALHTAADETESA